MPAAYRSHDSATVDNANLVINKPSGVVDGDFLICAILNGTSGATVNQTCTGWTQQVAKFGAQHCLTVLTKVASSEPSSWTFVPSALHHEYGVVVAISGSDGTFEMGTARNSTDTEGSDVGVVDITLTTTKDGCLIAFGGEESNSGAQTFTLTGGSMTERLDVSGSSDTHIGMWTQDGTTAGAKSATITSTDTGMDTVGVFFLVGNAADWITWDDAVVATTDVVTGLTNGVTYEFRVAGINAEGQGAWSNVLEATPESAGVSVTLAPQTITVSPQALTITVGAVTRNLSPIVATVSPVALTISAGATTRTLSPLTVNVTQQALTVTPGAVTIALVSQTVTMTPQALTITAGAVALNLSPNNVLVTQQPLTISRSEFVDLVVKVATVEAVALTISTGEVVVTLVPQTITVSPQTLTIDAGGEPPPQPVNLTTDGLDEAVFLDWDAGSGGDPADDYIVQWRQAVP